MRLQVILSDPSDTTVACGVDIGGANLKLAIGTSRTLAVPFAMWRDWKNLAGSLRAALNKLGCTAETQLAVTMTGELADCFGSRSEGVQYIVEQVRAVCDTRAFVYSVDGQWLSLEQAQAQPWDVAASNWYALAQWIAQIASEQFVAQGGVVVDIGSTTVDVIPVYQGGVWTEARTDRDRLQKQQLVYTGYERTPVAAILPAIQFEGRRCPLMAERFADSLDAYLVLGDLPEQSHCTDTADGRPRTKTCALSRLARMIGEDRERVAELELVNVAEQLAAAQAAGIAQAIQANAATLPKEPGQSSGRPTHRLCFTGHGHGLARRVEALLRGDTRADWVFESLAHRYSDAAARCGPAVAVAELWRQRTAGPTR